MIGSEKPDFLKVSVFLYNHMATLSWTSEMHQVLELEEQLPSLLSTDNNAGQRGC